MESGGERRVVPQPEQAGRRNEGRIVDVGVRGNCERVVLRPDLRLHVVADQSRLVPDRTGIEDAAQPGFRGQHLGVLQELPGGQGRGVAAVVDDVLVEEDRRDVGALGADLEEAGEPGRNVVLEAQRAVQVVGLQALPWLIGASVGIGRRRELHPCRHEDAALEGADVASQETDITVDPRRVATEVEAQRQGQPLRRLIVHRRLAAGIGRVGPQTDRLVGTEAAADIDRAAELGIGQIERARLGNRLVGGALGHQVDGAADGARQGAVQKGRGAAEHLDPFDAGRVRLAGHDAVKAAQPVVVVGHEDAADHGAVVEHVAVRPAQANGGIAGEHVGQRARLLTLDVFLGVDRLAERRVHEVAVAEQADLAAARDLAAGVGGRQVADLGLRWRRARLHAHGIELHGARPGRARDRDGIGGGELVRQTRASEELAQSLFRRHRAVDAAARLAGDGRRINGDLHAGLSAERCQGLRERLRRDVEARCATGLGLGLLALRRLCLCECCRCRPHRDGRQQQRSGIAKSVR